MKKYINILLVILWMIFIFYMSSCNADESSYQSGMIVNFIAKLINIDNINILILIIRKLAHFTEYLILGLLVYNIFNNSYNKSFILSLFLCLIYAISDEIHQIYVPGRSCQITDILIDISGSFIGIYLIKKIKLKKDK